MADIDIKFEQDKLANLVAKLGKLPPKLTKRGLPKGLRAGGRPIIKDAKNRINSKSGNLKRSIGAILRRYPESGNVALVIGPRTNGKFKGFHGHLVEFGTKPHVIGGDVRAGSALAFAGRVIDEVHHPGTKPRPFLRPALEMNKSQSIKAIADKLRQEIDKFFAKT